MPDMTESTQNASGENGAPTPEPQGAQGVSQNSPDVESIVAKVVERLLPELDKRTQSTKDKRIADILKTVGELQKSLAGDVESPAPVPTPDKGTPTEAQTVTPPVQDKPAAQVNHVEVDTMILGKLGLPKDDPAVIAVQSLPFEQRVLEYFKAIDRRNQPPNEAAVASQGGSIIKDKDSMAAELVELQNFDPMDRSGRQKELRRELGI